MIDMMRSCPFCGGSGTPSIHSDDCYFTARQKVREAAPGDLSMVPDLIAAWNRRAPSSATTAGERQSIDDGEFQRLEVAYVRALHACEDDLTAENANAASNARAALIAHIDTWAARSAGDAVDAERYRHLRNGKWFEQGFAKTEPNASAFNYAGELLDSMVDKARGAAPAPGNTAQPSGKEE